ncbi:hypothetical protein QP150_16985 [Sphingomonas sp. 22L2VL55-3]
MPWRMKPVVGLLPAVEYSVPVPGLRTMPWQKNASPFERWQPSV